MTVDESLVLYCQKELPGVLECFKTEFARIEFLELLKLLVLAHRHARNDEFLANPRVPFDTVRDTMYKYSHKAQERFFEQGAFSFLFIWFALSQSGRKFAAERFAENDDPRHAPRMFREIESMHADA